MNSTSTRRERFFFVVITVFLSLCVLANMILIFCMSAEDMQASDDRSDGVTDVVVDVVYPDIEQRPPAEQESIFQSTAHFVRKAAHFCEFALLGCLSILLLSHLSLRLTALRLWLRWTTAALFCLLYAISDEVHQIFSGRGPAVTDVLIDFAGSVAGILFAVVCLWIARRISRAARKRKDAKGIAA